MKRAVVHIVGAGVAGLAAARMLATSGRCDVVLHEARPQAGGRRRSFFDDKLGLDVDTGNFPLLSSWSAALSLVEAVGARGEWQEEKEPGVAFADFSSGERWRLTPNAGLVPWWLLDPRRRGPGLKFSDYWAARRLLLSPQTATVASLAPQSGIAMDRLWRPLCAAALNCPPEKASASLAEAALRELIRSGGRGIRLLMPATTFGRAFVDPLARRAERDGATLRFQRRLMSLECAPDCIRGLEFENDRLELRSGDALVLATPWTVAATLVPGMEPPRGGSPALTIHFAAVPPCGAPPVLGVLGAVFNWMFCYRDRMSVTVGDQQASLNEPGEALAAECWRGVAALTGFSDALPPWRIIRSRRVRQAWTPELASRRPSCRTQWRNLFLAGGYVGGSLPDCVESAVRSGESAARAFLGGDG
jgi:squalene-associated FAD-dependent desaturase